MNKVLLTDAVPDIEKYWDYEANEGKKPSDFGASSSEKVWTKCPICGTSVKRNIRYTWEKDKNGVGHVIHCRTCGKRNNNNSLVVLFPDIKKHWIYEKNEHDPEYYSISSGKKVYTSCPSCGEERYIAICDLIVKRNDRYELTQCIECSPKRNVIGSIAKNYPDIDKYWDDSNASNPDEIALNSQEIIFIHCPTCDKVVKRKALNSFRRDDQTGLYMLLDCHKCATQKAGKIRGLNQSGALIDKCPEIEEWWDAENNTIEFKNITRGSHYEAQLKCPACHSSFTRQIHSFVNVKRDGRLLPVACPECGYSTKGDPKDNILKLCPEIEQWWDYEANSPYRPEQFSKGSQFKAHFICPDCEMHLYTGIHSLMKSDENGNLHIRHKGKCLKFRLMESDNNLVKQYPQIKEWWDYEENGKALPEEFTIYSGKRMHFICPQCGAKSYRRVTDAFAIEANSGEPILFNCPYCRNKKVLAGKNSLLDTDPELAKEWSPNNNKKANEVLSKSFNRVQWICPNCKGEYSAIIRDRKVGDDACPYCKNDKVLPGFNSLQYKNPELAEEWSANNELKANEVLPTSSSRVKWVCPTCRGEYYAIIRGRKVGDDACPYCRKDKLLPGYNSLLNTDPELAKEWSNSNDMKADEVLPTSSSRVKWVCQTCRGEYSAIIRERKVGDDACPYCRNDKLLPGYNSLQDKKPELAKEWSTHNTLKADAVLFTSSSRAQWVCPTCHKEYSAIIRDRKLGDDSCPHCRQTKLLKEHISLWVVNPELAKEWSDSNDLKADEVLPTSSFRVKWVCPTCRGEYYAIIRDRKVGDDACPYCRKDKLLPGYNSLLNTDPELAKEWSNSNDLKASEVLPTSSHRAQWVCPTCHGEYSAIIRDRKVDDDACPYCRNDKLLPGYNSLQDKKPELAKEWSTRNTLKADTVLFTSSSRVKWVCPTCRGEYYAAIRDRKVGDDACPYCRNDKVLPGYNSLLNTDPELAKEWSNSNDMKDDEVLPTSSSRVKWVCPTCRGEYSAIIRERKVGDDACPYCKNDKVLPGFNSLQYKNPELAKEWSANNVRKADEVLPTSSSRVKWVCPTCRGEYFAIIRDRKVGDDACPYCKNDKVLPGFNSLQYKNPELAKEWSNSNDMKADEVLSTSSSRVKWVCPTCRGEYYAAIRDRKVGDDACPYCRKDKLLPGYNSLQDRQSELVEREWCYPENILIGVYPDQILESYQGQAWWKCPTCKRKYLMSVKDRLMKQKRGHVACPQCRGRRRVRSFWV